MKDETILRYIKLVDRRLQIVMNSGVSWKPEYGGELNEIDVELAQLRKVVNAEHNSRMVQRCAE